MISYEGIKAAAKAQGLSIRDFIALAPKNDPFYVGTPGELTKARWFTDLWERFGYRTGIHLRRMHYRIDAESPPIMKPNGRPYENSVKDWQYLCQVSKYARYLDTVSPSAFVDRKNPDPIQHAQYWDAGQPGYSLADFEGWALDLPKFDIHGYTDGNLQPYLLEIWVEKSTMHDVLLPLCRQYGVNLISGEGEMSITSTLSLVRRVEKANRPCRIFYISDFDPTGYGMPISVARKIEFFVRAYDLNLDIRLEPVMLSRDQVISYALPRKPIKPTDLRRGGFEAIHGEGAVELDALEALHPGELARIVRSAILEYHDEEIEAESRKQRRQLAEALEKAHKEAIEDLSEDIAALEQQLADLRSKMTKRLKGIEVDLDEYPLPESEEIDERGGQLFDSTRNYVEQLIRYKERRAGL